MQRQDDENGDLEEALHRLNLRLEIEQNSIDALFRRAQILAKLGRDAAAKADFLSVLYRDPAHFGALTDLAGLSLATGFRSAAMTAYRQAVAHHPGNPYGLVNLANLLLEDGDHAGARILYENALQVQPDLTYAHRGLAHIFSELGDTDRAAYHRDLGYRQANIVHRPYRGAGSALRVLLLVSVRGGNLPADLILDDRIFTVTAIYVEYHDRAAALPEHDVIFNAIGDADLCADALAAADEIAARSPAPLINQPRAVAPTGRASNALRLAGLPDVKVPCAKLLPRNTVKARTLAGENFSFPLLLRTPGYHTGKHFERVGSPEEIDEILRRLPGDPLLAIEYCESPSIDGLFRKYRALMIGGALYPLHLAISASWKVHYFTSAMADNPALREEERRFLTDMRGTVGARAFAGLEQLRDALALDYGGADFTIAEDGRILVFEANATMAIVPPGAESMWDYRRAACAAAIEAARELVFSRGARLPASTCSGYSSSP